MGVFGDIQSGPCELTCLLCLHQEAAQASFQGDGAIGAGFQGGNPGRCGHIQHIEPDPGPGQGRALGVCHRYGQSGSLCIPAGFVVHQAHPLTLHQSLLLQSLADEIEKDSAAHHHGPAGGAVEPAPVQNRLWLTGAQEVPVSLDVDLYPGVVVVAMAPPGHINLPCGNADRPEGCHAKGGLLSAPAQAAVVAGDGVHGTGVCGLIGHLPGAPAVDSQGCFQSRQPLYLRGHHLGEKVSAVHQILRIDAGVKDMVEKNIFGHVPAVGGVLPQVEGVTSVG